MTTSGTSGERHPYVDDEIRERIAEFRDYRLDKFGLRCDAARIQVHLPRDKDFSDFGESIFDYTLLTWDGALEQFLEELDQLFCKYAPLAADAPAWVEPRPADESAAESAPEPAAESEQRGFDRLFQRAREHAEQLAEAGAALAGQISGEPSAQPSPAPAADERSGAEIVDELLGVEPDPEGPVSPDTVEDGPAEDDDDDDDVPSDRTLCVAGSYHVGLDLVRYPVEDLEIDHWERASFVVHEDDLAALRRDVLALAARYAHRHADRMTERREAP